jgi:bifunctional non-homologous end joining protein LigD
VIAAEPPAGSGWIQEIKHDGFRTMLRIDSGQVRTLTRGGHNWKHKYQSVVETCRRLSCRLGILAMLNYSVAMSP